MTVAATRLSRVAVLACPMFVAALVAGCAGPRPWPGAPDDGAAVVPASQRSARGEDTDERRRARIRLALAASHYQQRNYRTALEELGEALRVEPDYAPAHGMLGLVYMDIGETARAEQGFRRALQLAPGDSELNNNYGWFLCQNGREREAIGFFERALADPLYRTPAKPLHNAGICSLRIGDETGAERYLQRAFQIDPSDPVAMFNLGELYLARNEYERARFYAQRLMAGFEPSAQILWLALRIERALGNRDDEASLALQLQRRFPASPEAALLAAGRYSG